MQFKRLATTLHLAAFLALVFWTSCYDTPEAMTSAEAYLKSEAWGVAGFTFTDRDAAFAKLREIVASADTPVRFGQKEKRNRLEKSPT